MPSINFAKLKTSTGIPLATAKRSNDVGKTIFRANKARKRGKQNKQVFRSTMQMTKQTCTAN
ncbi:hypothetical protein M5D96_001236 [Drosophila gunungcola]|uniref:Uncharacterized protein n=1 Tax=Drosophila gunungcola TaxID=103775 RepID=A0A9P9YYL1_9MUSC|nr:hypothetical protein M5D96_001236 [Drosophila gunungcola]